MSEDKTKNEAIGAPESMRHGPNSADSRFLSYTSNLPLGELLSRHSPVMMQVIDEQRRIVEVNQYWLDKMGYTVDQVLGRPLADFLAPDHVERFRTEFAPLMSGDRFTGVLREFITARGEILELEVNGRIIRDVNGKNPLSISVLVDVTSRNRREREIRSREEELRTLIDNSPEGILIHTAGIYVYANRKACEILGLQDQSEIIGKGALDIVHPSIREEVRRKIQDINTTSVKSAVTERVFVHANGDPIHVESSGSQVTFQGKPSVQVIFRDISDRKRVEAIARQNEVQSELIRQQREMLLAVSTPLLPLREHVVLMPLVGDMDDVRGDRATETLLNGIGEHGARIAILDVTGVPTIGPAMAEGLRRTIHAAQLLGAEVVVTGIQPAIAKTMIELSLDMSGIVTKGTLRDGIAYAFRRAR